MFRVLQTDSFAKWLNKLQDLRAKGRIVARVDALGLGHFGDVKHLGGKIAEIRIDTGPGYRVYFTQQGSTVVILLCGGDKSSQTKDIARARSMLKEIG